MLFPRLSGGLVASLNRQAFTFPNLECVPTALIDQSHLQKAMLFEMAIVKAERILDGDANPEWDDCIKVATHRQSKFYDAKPPSVVSASDRQAAEQAAQNLVAMLRSLEKQNPKAELKANPEIPGLGWIASGTGDFSLGHILIEVKHTDRNFVSGDFRQVLIYWILKYAASIESDEAVWSDCILLNPRRNSAVHLNFDKLLYSASASSSRVELCELLRSIADRDISRM